MTEATALRPDDLRFINLVAIRRFDPAHDPAEPQGLEAALGASQNGSPHTRAATLAHELLSRHVFATAALPSALLAMVTQLARDGMQLLAPQGAIVGMIRELEGGGVDVTTVARWLEDRAVPSSSEG